MSVQGSGNKPYIPEDHDKVEKKFSKTKSSKDKSVSDLKHKVQTDTAEKPIQAGKVSKKSTKGERERKTFEQEAEAKGYKFSKTLGLYQSIKHPDEMITVSEMEGVVHNVNTVLLPELFEQVLSILPENDFKTVNSVNKNWKREALQFVIIREKARLNAFGKSITKKMHDQDKSGKVMALVNENKLDESKDLMEVRSALLDLREQLVFILKDCTTEDLLVIKSPGVGKTPLLFENVPLLVRGYSEVAHAKEKKRDLSLRQFVGSLLYKKMFEEALKVTNMMTPGMDKSVCLEKYSYELIQECLKNFKAKEAKGEFRNEDVVRACEILKENRNWIYAAETGNSPSYQINTFKALLSMKQDDLVEMLANAIIDPAKRERAFRRVEMFKKEV